MNQNWDELVRDIGPRLYRYFCARFSSADAADLTQESLIRLVRKVQQGQFNTQKGSLAAYAFGIAYYVGLEFKSSPFTLVEDKVLNDIPHDSMGADDRLIKAQDGVQARQALLQLPLRQQQTLALMIDEELTMEQIAQILGVPEGTVKSDIYRAKQSLREILLNLRSQS